MNKKTDQDIANAYDPQLAKLKKSELVATVINERERFSSQVEKIGVEQAKTVEGWRKEYAAQREQLAKLRGELAEARCRLAESARTSENLERQLAEKDATLHKQDGSLAAYELVISMLTGKRVPEPECAVDMKCDPTRKQGPRPSDLLLKIMGLPV